VKELGREKRQGKKVVEGIGGEGQGLKGSEKRISRFTVSSA